MAKKPTPPPAPSKLSPEVIDRICEGVALGLPYERACLLGGIRRETAPSLRAAGADLLVPGSLLFKGEDLMGTAEWLRGLP